MPPTTPYAGKFASYPSGARPQPHSPYHSGPAHNATKEGVYSQAVRPAENPSHAPQPHPSYHGYPGAARERHHSSDCPVADNPYSSPRQHSVSCPARAYRHSSSSGSSGEQPCRNGSVTARGRIYAPAITASYGEMCYHDNSLVSASLEALIQHLVPTVDYYPDVRARCRGNARPVPRRLLSRLSAFLHQRSYVFTFLLSSRLFLHPYELMTRVCHLCVEQQRSGDALLDKVGGVRAGRCGHASLEALLR